MAITAFLEDAQVTAGTPAEVQQVLETRYAADLAAIRIFDDASGRVVDLDFWDALKTVASKGRGRPNLGVRAREVTLLPQQWDWLASQPGGASAVLRRLVDDARRKAPDERARQNAIYTFMRDACGDRPGYEEALRALYRGDAERFATLTADWPVDIRAYIDRLGRSL